MENIIVALSNFTSLLPIYTSYIHNDNITTYIILFASLASVTSHLVENHKHGMPGIGFSKKTSYYLNQVDVFGYILVGMRMVYLYYHKYGPNIFPFLQQKKLIFFILVFFIILRVSEHDKYNPNLKKLYMITHCIWHVGIFIILNEFLTSLIYQSKN